jgi:outer membrane protein TolC
MDRRPRRIRALAPRVLALLAAATAPGSAPAQEAAGPLTLEEALALARAGSEVSGIAAARVERAEALRHQAISTLVPALTLSGTYTRRAREVTRTVDDDEVVVQARDAHNEQALVESTLFDLRALPLIRAASRSLAAQRIESRELERALAFDVADTFYTALAAERLRAAAARRVEVARATVEETRIRLDAGLANRNDFTRADLELATARLEATRAARDAATARLSLAFLIAAPVDRPLAEPIAPPRPPNDVPALGAAAHARSGKLAALAERAAAARQAALAPRLGIVPTLDGRGTFRRTNEAGLSGREEDWNVALTLTWALFDGGSRAAVAAELAAVAREAELTLAEAERRVAVEVEQAAQDLDAADAAFTEAEAQQRAARQNAEEVRERYRAGLATALEQADAQVAEFEAESALARQGFARAISRLALERAVGGDPLLGETPAAATEAGEATETR